ncbi:MAG TPA: hypothetical protein ENH35_02655 [Candidatus Moranbacteria bacterium]|nr:hypothetical protein [Candidatus Moranbacteria bacterium]HDZ85417.1 hypothetical protein [Candidatus Moranbacteria bacterium]
MGKDLYGAPWGPETFGEVMAVNTGKPKKDEVETMVAICPNPDKAESIRTTEELRNTIFDIDNSFCSRCLKCKCLLMDMKTESMKINMNAFQLYNPDNVLCKGCGIKESCFLNKEKYGKTRSLKDGNVESAESIEGITGVVGD